MGVPAFFRWLTKKYPSVVVNANEDRQRTADGTRIPIDSTQPNPNFQEFDNLYLDMNGIIHPCTHPEDRPPPKNEDEMFALIFEYIDRIFSIVRPRKVLYMAIDGVAPRAKMNQQRSRRFRASKEAWEKQASIDEQRRRLAAEGIPLPPKKEAESHFDSNCITPGTPFMARLADALRYYIHDRITSDPAWAKIQVILSDANAPGEGEHKIMDFVRKQRANPAHNPDTVHCLCGADADLIMLGLATHEANFNIIREEFVPNQQRPCELCGQYGHELKDCRGLENEEKGVDHADPLTKETSFIFLRLPVLREYLEKEMAMASLPFAFDLERVIDDWVFLCFFVGNDFLPHLPSLEIREGAIDRLIKLYKEAVYEMNGYMTKSGEVYMEQVQKIMIGLGKVEDDIFKRRQVDEERFQQRNKRFKMNGGGRGRTQRPAYTPQQGSLIAPLSQATPLTGEETRALAAQDRVQAMQFSENEEAARRLKAMLKMEGTPDAPASDDSRKRKAEIGDSSSVSGSDSEKTDTPEQAKLGKNKPKSKKGQQKKKTKKARGVKRPPPKPKQPPPLPKAPLIIPEGEEESGPVDQVRLYETGWKDRYYRAKFDVGADDMKFRETVAWAYVEGLCWVLKYYYQGCVSWDWYFPYHYAPFASDFDTIINYKPDFSRPTKPFNPLEQLMSVFPAASKQHLPVEWQKLMVDDESPIIDLYPTDFRIDLNGKKYAWQGVALLPFVDEVRLLKTLERVYPTLTKEEKARNTIGPNRLFLGRHHPAFKFFMQLYDDESQVKTVDIDPAFTYGVTGAISADSTVVLPDAVFKSPVCDDTCPDIPVNGAIGVLYDDPSYPAGFIFPATRLDSATPIPPTLKPGDWNDRSQGGYRPQIGFSRDTGRASVDQSGHRTLNHEVRDSDGYRNSRGGGGYRGGQGGRGGGYNNYDNRGGYGGGGRGGNRGGYNDGGNRGGYNDGGNRGGYNDGGNRGGYNDGGYRNDYNRGQNNRYDDRNGGEHRGGGYGGQRGGGYNGGGNRGRGRGGGSGGGQQSYGGGSSWR